MLSAIIIAVRQTIYLDPTYGWCPDQTVDNCSIEVGQVRDHESELVNY